MVGFYAGSFDPFTNGHLQIVKKASKCFEKVIVGIGHNSDKTERIDKEEMRVAIEETVREMGMENVVVVIYEGLTVDAAKAQGADILIRGLRNGTDYQYEENISEMNEKMAGIDTCYFRAGELGYLSSSFVMELFNHNKPVDEYVPEKVAKLLYQI